MQANLITAEMVEETDDYYFDYIPTTIDVGHWVFTVTCAYSLLCIIALPILVTIGNNRARRLEKQKEEEQKHSPTFDTSSADSVERGETGKLNPSDDSEDEDEDEDNGPSLETPISKHVSFPRG